MTSSRLRRALSAVLLTASVVLPLAVAQSAEALAPTATGWWSFATRDGLPQPPSPPDVQDGDLLVQGGGPSGTQAGTDAPPSAVAAVRFVVPSGSTVTALRLQVGDNAVASDVRAYATPPTWQPAQGGPLQDAPQPDRSRFSKGVLQAGVLVFPDVARLLPRSGILSVVLLPGSVDRVVLKKPTATALAVTAPPTAQESAPAPSGAQPAQPAMAATAQPAAVEGSTDVAAAPPLSAGGSPALPPADPPAPGQQPALASPPDTTAPAAPAAAVPEPQASAARNLPAADDTRTRYFAAAEAVLVLALFGLLGWGPLGRLAASVPTAGPLAAPSPDERGVGRFVRARTGRPVRL